jgi:hypothetical protein
MTEEREFSAGFGALLDANAGAWDGEAFVAGLEALMLQSGAFVASAELYRELTAYVRGPAGFPLWATGPLDGGPEGDGRYPLIGPDGAEVLVPGLRMLREQLAKGEPGADAGVSYTFVTGAGGNPGLGNIRANDDNLVLATELQISDTTEDGLAAFQWVDSFDDSSHPTDKGTLTLRRRGTVAFHTYTVKAVIPVDTQGAGGNYRRVTVSWLSGGGDFINGGSLLASFTRTGDTGLTPTIEVGQVLDLPPSMAPAVEITGPPNAKTVNFALVRGDDGHKGWAPAFGVVEDGERRVHRIIDWVGGTGPKPTGVGAYLGAGLWVANATDATDVRGGSGPQGIQGPKGDNFQPNASGTFAQRSGYDNAVPGFSYLATDQSKIYFRETTTPGVWSTGITFGPGALTGADIAALTFLAPYGTRPRSTLQRLGETINLRELYEGEADHVPAWNRMAAQLNANTNTAPPSVELKGAFDLTSTATQPLTPLTKNHTDFRGVGGGTVLILANSGEALRFGRDTLPDGSPAPTTEGLTFSNCRVFVPIPVLGQCAFRFRNFARARLQEVECQNVGALAIMGGSPVASYCQDIKFRDIDGYAANLGQTVLDARRMNGFGLSRAGLFVGGVPAIQSAAENLATVVGTRLVGASSFSVDTIHLDKVFAERFDAMLFIEAKAGQVINNIKVDGATADYCNNSIVAYVADGGIITTLHVGNSYLTGWGGNAILLDGVEGGRASRATFEGLSLFQTLRQGLLMRRQWKNTKFSGLQVYENDRAEQGFACVEFDPGCTRFSLSDSQIGFSEPDYGYGFRGDHAVRVGAECDDYSITGIDAEGSVAGWDVGANSTASKKRSIRGNGRDPSYAGRQVAPLLANGQANPAYIPGRHPGFTIPAPGATGPTRPPTRSRSSSAGERQRPLQERDADRARGGQLHHRARREHQAGLLPGCHYPAQHAGRRPAVGGVRELG